MVKEICPKCKKIVCYVCGYCKNPECTECYCHDAIKKEEK